VHVRRASAKVRRELQAAQVDEATAHCAAINSAAAQTINHLTGFAVGEVQSNVADAGELQIEVAFAGVRSGRLTVGFSRGLTRQIATAMAAMVDLDGRPLGPIEAAKELASAIAHGVLVAVFGAENMRLNAPQATTAHRFGDRSIVLGVADGCLAIDFHLDQSRL
jgi:hypothetical protein